MFTLPIACVLPLELRKDAHLYQQGEYPYYSPYQLVSTRRLRLEHAAATRCGCCGCCRLLTLRLPSFLRCRA